MPDRFEASVQVKTEAPGVDRWEIEDTYERLYRCT